ncbi:LysR substrate-binding domain-containing protein [Dongia mobilis]|uniref:LysR substrate-binding domain-containing protein n=1 Tax=Dongia sp. TaxID=1977262 RepID=UPI0026EB34F8
MRPAPPPFPWLRAFEATARHLSMTRAAAELNISASAVSQQIASLEAYLGRALFKRANRRLTLTASGALMAPKLTNALTLLHEAIDDSLPSRRGQTLNVKVTTSFGSQWLMNRLDDFRKHHPALTVQVSATAEPIESARSTAEIEIRYGNGDWPDLDATLLVEERIFPVCHPDLLARKPVLRKPKDLAHHDLIDVPGYRQGWSDWLSAAGAAIHWTKHRIAVDQSVMAIQLALEGRGVALGRSPLIERELADGRLVAPFPQQLATGAGYWVVHRKRSAEARKVLAFKTWLLAQSTAPKPTKARITKAGNRSSRS